jgi:L-ribulose-5-phosphate 3-epimerase
MSFEINPLINRREAIKKASLIVAASASVGLVRKPEPRLQLGACDWSVGKSLNPEAFDRAKEIGLQGIQVSYNTGQNPIGLSDAATLQSIREASQRTGVKVSSLAIGELNRNPYKSDPKTEAWVAQSIDAAKELGVKVILLAFFSAGDLRNDEAGKKEVVARLKKVAPHAEKQGIILGIESYLTAREHLDIIQAVGSPAIKVYYDFRNAADAGNDVFEEVPMIGKDLICELHMKENGQRLGEGTMDWPKIAKMVKDMGYTGWMQIEGATPNGAEIVPCYQYNRKYLEGLFSFK